MILVKIAYSPPPSMYSWSISIQLKKEEEGDKSGGDASSFSSVMKSAQEQSATTQRRWTRMWRSCTSGWYTIAGCSIHVHNIKNKIKDKKKEGRTNMLIPMYFKSRWVVKTQVQAQSVNQTKTSPPLAPRRLFTMSSQKCFMAKGNIVSDISDNPSSSSDDGEDIYEVILEWKILRLLINNLRK